MKTLLSVVTLLLIFCAPCAAENELFTFFSDPSCKNWNAIDRMASTEDEQAGVDLLKLAYINGIMDATMLFCYAGAEEGEDTEHCTFPLDFDEYIRRINNECSSRDNSDMFISIILVGINIQEHAR